MPAGESSGSLRGLFGILPAQQLPLADAALQIPQNYNGADQGPLCTACLLVGMEGAAGRSCREPSLARIEPLQAGSRAHVSRGGTSGAHQPSPGSGLNILEEGENLYPPSGYVFSFIYIQAVSTWDETCKKHLMSNRTGLAGATEMGSRAEVLDTACENNAENAIGAEEYIPYPKQITQTRDGHRFEQRARVWAGLWLVLTGETWLVSFASTPRTPKLTPSSSFGFWPSG